ncbi:5-carboxymethyl-2-hydroxymuconate Delta-isomerase [Stenotrophomonas sp. SY1]|uniref:5-carboxymethyl-2-hydroxymuconate Delta-isomerase n=1 Tax=Stenotrophomonas sp. SY1 TaxID=477235 RepID=UPI001E4ABD84|nr:5-carboxymethyl-2-hydroxymuconate Delta-isomerase [Stenotrophomonas sp. SY1]MCD9087730.1 5-carboxymethyl-2-hydroxymuconate Delta-isomerase [Stenotrophomonas sp. SY1]
MPHLTIEYSSNLGNALAPALLHAANGALMRTGQFQEADIKSRAIAFDDFAIGSTDTARAFVAAKLSILSGRTAQTKREIAQALLVALEAAIAADGLELQTSVEILDIDRDSYAKSHRHG